MHGPGYYYYNHALLKMDELASFFASTSPGYKDLTCSVLATVSGQGEQLLSICDLKCMLETAAGSWLDSYRQKACNHMAPSHQWLNKVATERHTSQPDREREIVS